MRRLTTEGRLWREHAGPRGTLHAAVLLAAVAAGAWLAFVVLLAQVTGRVFLHGAAPAALAGPLALMLGLAAARGGLLWASEAVAQRAAEAIKGSLRARIAAQLVALGPMHTRGERAGEILYVAGEGVEALDGYVTGYRPARLLAGVVPVMAAALVLVIDPWAALILVFAWPVLVLLLALIGGRVRDAAERRQHELAWMSAHLLDVLRGLPTLKLFGRSREHAATIETVSRRFGATTMDVLRTAFQTSLVLEWGATAATALVAIEASLRVMTGGLPFELALAALLLAPELFLPLRRLSLEYHAGHAGRAAAARIYAVLDQPLPRRARARRSGPPANLDLGFHDVRVAYEAGTRPALDGFSLQVAHGQTVALVGATGAGKTTVANLLLRFVEPDAGLITVGGVRLDDIDPARWRARVAWVPQHPSLFHGTVAENIRLARPGATDAQVVAAARAARLHAVAAGLPAGYDTMIGEGGARLSGGERQRLAIARAVIKDAPVLVLDEATSHLDEETESLVLDALARLGQGRTVLVIAHGTAPARRADLVALMERGRVIETRAPGWLAGTAS